MNSELINKGISIKAFLSSGLSKSFIITPMVVALIASIAVVLFGYYMLESDYPGALVLVLMFFLKVAFSKPRVESPSVSPASPSQKERARVASMQ